MKKNEIITLKIENFGSNGEGVAHYGDATVFVPFSLPQDEISAKLLKVKGNIAYAKVDNILKKSPYRIDCSCPVFEKCGGCQLQHCIYDKQLEFKTKLVRDSLKKIACINCSLGDIVKSDKVYGYRNKLQLPIRATKGGNKIGFFRENSHDIVVIDKCPLHGEWAEKIIKIINDYILTSGVTCYDEINQTGDLKHLVIRCIDNVPLVVLVSVRKSIIGVNRLIEALKQDFDDFSLILNINKFNNNIIFGKEFITLYGTGKISLFEFGIRYDIDAESFMQVNCDIKSKLYSEVLDCAEADSNTIVIDGYSGAGVLTAMLARNAKQAYGVEIVENAVKRANELAELNGLGNKMSTVCDDCVTALPQLIEQAKQRGFKVVLVLDPPRKGVDRKILQSILKFKPDKLIYISCSPQTMARDVGILIGTLKIENNAIINSYADVFNFKIEKILPFDMFPQTKHVETLVVLTNIGD